jgi:hypothetical protein
MRGRGVSERPVNPWGALAALCIGFFMILLDATIVSIAIPAMLRGLNASLNAAVWVTSIYPLTYAVPMLFTSRLGDRFGPKRVFMAGLWLFTAASLWCGPAGDVGTLITARWRAGHRRRADDAADPGVHQLPVPAGPARRRHGRVGRHRRPGHRGRALFSAANVEGGAPSTPASHGLRHTEIRFRAELSLKDQFCSVPETGVTVGGTRSSAQANSRHFSRKSCTPARL